MTEAERQTGQAPGAPSATHRRRERTGVVVSDAMTKTVVVRVEQAYRHPKYEKIVRRSRSFYAHDEHGQAHVGDIVRIRETRPMSKLKRWRVVEVVRAAHVPGQGSTAEA